MATKTRKPATRKSAKPALSEAEKDERDAAREAQVAEIKARFDERLAQIASNPDEWVTFLDTVAHFGARYSIGNQMLLLWQAEDRGIDPQYFLPYGYAPWITDPKTGRRTGRGKGTSGWLKAGQQVRKGEHGYMIWAGYPVWMNAEEIAAALGVGKKLSFDDKGRVRKMTGFKIERTFELGQTEQIDPAAAPFQVPTVQRRRTQRVGGGMPELLTGEDPTNAFDDVVKLIIGRGFSFHLVAPGTGPLKGHPGSNGVANYGTREVGVRDDVSTAQQTKTALHELAHILLDHETRPDASRGQRECEAESVAHIVSAALGLDTTAYTDNYVLGWAGGDMEIIKATASRVMSVAKKILAELDPGETAEEVAA